MIAFSIWWVVCAGVWLLGLGTVTVEDAVAGAAAGALSALLAVLARQLVHPPLAAPRQALQWLGRLPLTVPVETALVLAAVLRRARGHEQSLPVPRERAARRDARAALAVLALSASPGSVVVDADPAEHAIRVHTLGRPAPSALRIDPGAR